MIANELSKSVGNISSCDLAGFHRGSTIERASSTRYSGYLFKRSNKPSEERITLETAPLTFNDQEQNTILQENLQHEEQPQTVRLAPGNHGSSFPSPTALPVLPDLAVIPTLLPSKPDTELNGMGIQNAIDLMTSFFGQHHTVDLNTNANGNEAENFETSNAVLSPQRTKDEEESSRSAITSNGYQLKPMALESTEPTKSDRTLKSSRTLPIAIVGSSPSSCRSQVGNNKKTPPIHHNGNVGTRNNVDRQDPPPESVIDSHDAHIWRAKYCVLVEKVLYFYYNEEIGNSQEAELERDRMSTHPQYSHTDEMNEIDHLGKSPMPRNLHPLLTAKEKNGGGSFCHDPNVYWEKRVALNMVGAVRSAPDFGEKAFELIAMSSGEDSDGDDDVDRLIMRANDANEVKDWIFEIHKSFVVLMKEYAAAVGSNDKRQTDDFDPASLEVPPKTMNRCRSTSGAIRTHLLSPKNPMVISGPGFAQSDLAASLSHGREKSTRRQSFGDTATLQNLPISPSMGSTTRARANSDDHVTSSFPLSKIPSHRSSIRLNTDIRQSSMPDTRHSIIEDKQKQSIPIGENKSSSSKGKYVPPHLRNQKYIPPHMRNKLQVEISSSENDPGDAAAFTDEIRQQIKSENNEFETLQVASRIPIISENNGDELSNDGNESDDSDSSESASSDDFNASPDDKVMKLGGCADPMLAQDSICHDNFKSMGASKVTSDCCAYGCVGETSEIGAVSRCGIRDYNEDAYLILTDLFQTRPSDDIDPFDPSESYFSRFQQHGLFAIFDGHCGNQAARYAAEKFHCILLEESLQLDIEDQPDPESVLHKILLEAVTRLDHEFCVFSTMDGRDWYAGSTAIIVLVLDGHLAVASVGDAGGVFSSAANNVDRAIMRGWSVLEQQDLELNKLGGSTRGIIYKEVSESHCPSSPEERERIQAANGWITHETDLPMITHFHRMDWGDRDVRDIFYRCFSDRLDTAKPARILDIYRVCGDLAVSRAIGDREYKAAFNKHPDHGNEWTSPAPIPFETYKDIHKEDHSGLFEGDLVISTPGIRFFELGSQGGTDEFILIACDGLWDVIDPDDAVRLTRNLLFHIGLSAKKSADRLAELAKGLGSSDNITVIVVKFYDRCSTIQ